MTDTERCDLFWAEAVPVAHDVSSTSTTMWLAYCGEILQLRMTIDDPEVDVVIVEPDSAEMAQLLHRVDVDTLLDTITVSKQI
jgi:hypothetical protein